VDIKKRGADMIVGPNLTIAAAFLAFGCLQKTAFSFVQPRRSNSKNTIAVCSSSSWLAMSAEPTAPEPATTPTTTASEALKLGLFRQTPLIKSEPLTELVGGSGRDVYLKLDALQTSGSFKDRGMGHLCRTLQSEKGVTNLISSSGGNAGLAVATVGRQLGMSVQVVVPETTKPIVVDKLRSLGADVTVHGENWNAADLLARRRVADDASGTSAYVSPYDHELLWEGHSTVVDEIIDELARRKTTTAGREGAGVVPAAIVVSVGGGGLLCGTLEGLERRKLHESTAVIAAETEGAASFGKAWRKGELVRLDAIDSVATSLGALEVTPVALERANRYVSGGGVVKESACTDAEAVDACVKFSQDHRMLVEPACGAALAVVYSERLRNRLLDDLASSANSNGTGPIVVEVCGGSGVNLELLSQWKNDLSV